MTETNKQAHTHTHIMHAVTTNIQKNKVTFFASSVVVWKGVPGLLKAGNIPLSSPLLSSSWSAACCSGRAEAARQRLSPLNISAISSGKVAAIRRKQRGKGEVH